MQSLIIIDRQEREFKYYENGKCEKFNKVHPNDWSEYVDIQIAAVLSDGFNLIAANNSELFFVKEVDSQKRT